MNAGSASVAISESRYHLVPSLWYDPGRYIWSARLPFALDDGDFIMPLCTRFLLLILGLGIVGLLAGPVAADNDAEKIDQLIEQLGSGTFKDRESATKALDAIGAPALEKLRKAAESEDLEIKRRAADLVKRIEKRAESSRVLQAKRVHL